MCDAILYFKIISVNGSTDGDDSSSDDLDVVYFPVDNGGYCESLQAYMDFYGPTFPRLYAQSVRRRRREETEDRVGR